jgi:3-oxoisoapionate kinase
MSQLLLGYYGDDFSGSTDVLEVLSQAGLRTVLFLAPPRESQLARYPDARAIGIAGVSRSMPTASMDDELRPAFECLGRLAPMVHYKICSTFDSSPAVGSIGRAIDVGRELFATRCVPLVVGAPALGRYCVFGNLFARSGAGSPIYRLDRHPTMSAHPITPMQDADLTHHLSHQTAARISLLSVLDVETSAAARFEALEKLGAEVVLIDVLSDAHLSTIGALIDCQAEGEQVRFVVGSSGIEYALTAYWRATGQLPPRKASHQTPVAESVLVVSGSCSPVTAGQIRAAAERGFQCIALSPEAWLGGDVSAVAQQASMLLAARQSVIVHAALGPDDPRIAEARERSGSSAGNLAQPGQLGAALAEIVRAGMTAGVRRVAVTGGDTSGYVARALGIEALEFVSPIAPGSPLCRAVFKDADRSGLDLCFKGGQVGGPDFFLKLANGN